MASFAYRCQTAGVVLGLGLGSAFAADPIRSFAEVPTGRFRTELSQLKPAALARAEAVLRKLGPSVHDLNHLHVQADSGEMYYACPPPAAGLEFMRPVKPPRTEEIITTPTTPTPPVYLSKCGVANVLILNFSG